MSKLAPIIHRLDNYSIEARVRIIFVLSVKVDADFLKEYDICSPENIKNFIMVFSTKIIQNVLLKIIIMFLEKLSKIP